MAQPGYRKRTVFLLVALLLVRFWFGQTFELSGQEAYLWWQGHGQNLNASYWERGPFVPLLIRVGTAFFGDTELGVRWLAAVICCMSGFVIFYLARHWFNARAAFWAVVLFIIIPMYAWKFSFMTEAAVSTGLMALAMFAFSLAIESDKVWWWLLGGVACGLGLLVALANGWWIVGLLLYFAVSAKRRARLKEKRLWVTVIFSCLFLAPVAWWWFNGMQLPNLMHARIGQEMPPGSDVPVVAHAPLPSVWPLSHGFSVNQGFHFLGLELFYLSPIFVIVMGWVIWQLGRQFWEDPRYGMLACLAVPGLVWQNISAFFHEGHFELVPALCLPLALLAGCYLTRLTLINPAVWRVFGLVMVLAAAQSLAGLNPFYLVAKSDGHGYRLKRMVSGENVTGFYASKRQISWRNLADAVQSMQRDYGATLVITDTPETASALSFYLPRNPFVYVESKPGVMTSFDFWTGYQQSASPNDSALFVSHSTAASHPADPPSADIVQDFADVQQVQDPLLPDFDASWDFWNCQNYIGSDQGAKGVQTNPMPEHDSLPK